MNTIISKPTIKSIYIVKEIWWYIKEYIFGNEYWKRRFAPSLKSITEWAGETRYESGKFYTWFEALVRDLDSR